MSSLRDFSEFLRDGSGHTLCCNSTGVDTVWSYRSLADYNLRPPALSGHHEVVTERAASIRPQQPGQNALLDVHAVAGLLHHHAVRAVQYLVGHLFAAAGRQAVEEIGPGGTLGPSGRR